MATYPFNGPLNRNVGGDTNAVQGLAVMPRHLHSRPYKRIAAGALSEENAFERVGVNS